MAAARHVLIMCSSSEVDGYAFCLGLVSLGKNLREVTTRIIFLIQEAIFRSRSIPRKQGKLLMGIGSLGELADTCYAHKATKSHDKVYALLGMCSDDMDGAGLEPNYSLPWRILMKRVTEFLLGDQVSVDTLDEKRRVILKSKGCVLGKVSAIQRNNGKDNKQVVEITTTSSPGYKIDCNGHWLIWTSIQFVREGDLVCLLQGALNPTILRPLEGHFIIIVIGSIGLKRTDGTNAKWSDLAQSASFIRNFLLVWDWEISYQNQDPGPYNALTRANNLQSQHEQTESEIDMNDAIQRWNTARILEDPGELTKAKAKSQRTVEFFQIMASREHMHSLECHCSQTSLLWAAANGKGPIVDLILTTDNADLDLENPYGLTALSCAAEGGHVAVVRLLLKAGANMELEDTTCQTALSRAVKSGYETIVKLLLDAGADMYGDSEEMLSEAAQQGHEAIVKLLLNAGADVNKASGRAIAGAALGGHGAVVKLLLNFGADVNRANGRWALINAVLGGHEVVVKLLLNAGADVNEAGR
jgi:hypothetical protein